MLTRRHMLATLGRLALAYPLSRAGFALDRANQADERSVIQLAPKDEQVLEEIERAAFRFFWEQADSQTGLVKDSSGPDGEDSIKVSSIAATGFGLTALCIADRKGLAPAADLKRRTLNTLTFLLEHAPHEHGFFYHFLDMRSGARAWKSELSSIDTALLFMGVLTCRQHFGDGEIIRLADKLYQRVDWRWMLAGGKTLSHGWTPEGGFLKPRWDEYSEAMMLYLLAMGSPTYAIPAECWRALRRPWVEFYGFRYISTRAPIFVHQYSHAWIDFRNRRDEYADYFENSVRATRAHKLFCLSLRKRFPSYSKQLWGITASDSPKGYAVWGGPPAMGPIDGSVVPAAAAGSLPFTPQESLRVMHHMRDRFDRKIWKRYGFVDAFNPLSGWVSGKAIGINTGITLLMVENLRTGFVWHTFMKNPEIGRAMSAAEFRPATSSASAGA